VGGALECAFLCDGRAPPIEPYGLRAGRSHRNLLKMPPELSEGPAFHPLLSIHFPCAQWRSHRAKFSHSCFLFFHPPAPPRRLHGTPAPPECRLSRERPACTTNKRSSSRHSRTGPCARRPFDCAATRTRIWMPGTSGNYSRRGSNGHVDRSAPSKNHARFMRLNPSTDRRAIF